MRKVWLPLLGGVLLGVAVSIVIGPRLGDSGTEASQRANEIRRGDLERVGELVARAERATGHATSFDSGSVPVLNAESDSGHGGSDSDRSDVLRPEVPPGDDIRVVETEQQAISAMIAQADDWIAAQPRDAAWAADKEGRLRAFFDAGEIDAVLRSAECRSEGCVLSFRFNNDNALNEFYHHIDQPPFIDESGSTRMLPPDAGDYLEVRYYITRAGYRLPAQNVRVDRNQ